VARHKKQHFVCEVVQTDAGVGYRVGDKDFTSPSSAGRDVTGGVAVNGWRFWSLEGALKPRSAKTATKKAPAKKAPATKKGAKKAKANAQRAGTGRSYGCGVCGEEFPTMKAATKHATEMHLQ
jgi:hypothetical protein